MELGDVSGWESGSISHRYLIVTVVIVVPVKSIIAIILTVVMHGECQMLEGLSANLENVGPFHLQLDPNFTP